MLAINGSFVLRFVTLSLGVLPWFLDAAVMNYNGALDLSNPNEVFTAPLILNTTSNVTIKTFSYGGGLPVKGTVVQSGSFDPTVTLFRGIRSRRNLLDTSYFNDDLPPCDADPERCYAWVRYLVSIPSLRVLIPSC